MRFWISKDEWYPVYSIETEKPAYKPIEAEVSEEVYARFWAAFKEFDYVQKELYKLANKEPTDALKSANSEGVEDES